MLGGVYILKRSAGLGKRERRLLLVCTGLLVRPLPTRVQGDARGWGGPTEVKVVVEEAERLVGKLKGPEADQASKLFRPSAPEGGGSIWGGAPVPPAGSQFLSNFDPLCSSRSSKTFKPKKNIPEGSHQYELLKHAEATLGSGNLRQAVMLPEGEDLNEWIAVNTVDFFNQINMLYGTITEFCTEASCPVMSAGPRYEYHWADGTNIKKPIKCSAPKYIDYLMTWVQDQLDDETLFPSKIGVPFPKNFMSVAKTILKRLFRVYAHIYHQHFDSVMQLQEEAHLNTSFKHFIFFVQEFNLIDRRELAPLQELIEKLGSKDR
ncbi:MOB kinase activator 1A [Fukomys damarensis]|uniref:MOB kinase activator 1A n=1 Tax=Fukomys damarensis TaxID=885580 RepID=UPI00054000F2|nr:MOB kinase activator 1A [Fukomys damarensis]